jgi:hypothetical protein
MRKLVAVAFAGILASTNVSAATYDLVSDWGTSNPNVTWSFLQGTTLLPYQSTPLCCGLGVPGYAPGTVPGNFLPAFFESNGAGSDIDVHSVDPSNGDPSLGEATLVWTAPVSGIISYRGYLYYAQSPLSRSNDVTFAIGGVDQFTQEIGYTTYTGPGDEYSFSGSGVSVAAGETLTLPRPNGAPAFRPPPVTRGPSSPCGMLQIQAPRSQPASAPRSRVPVSMTRRFPSRRDRSQSRCRRPAAVQMSGLISFPSDGELITDPSEIAALWSENLPQATPNFRLRQLSWIYQ